MSHGLTETQQAASEAPVIRPVLMASLMFDPEPVHVHSGVGTILFGGNSFLGVGALGGISGVKEGMETRPYDINLTLTGIPTEYLAITLDQHYQGKLAVIYIALFDVEHVIIGDPVVIWKGFLDYASVDLGETATVNVTARNRLTDWQRPRIRRYTHEDQQSVYPGDTGLSYVATMADKELRMAKG